MRRMIISLFLLSGIIAFGVIGYHKVENMSIIDSLYMTIITISTVGFGEVKPLSVEGRIITMIIIGTWITIGAYTIGNLFRVLVEGELSKTFGRKKLEKQISQLKNHYIICGYGRIG
ncbi:MAG TPA: ion channel, partial [Spirochaetota bacterium]|nr:ion channel [Spirochaetota bacterium]